MEYKEFLETKKKSFIESGFDISEDDLNPKLKDFQKYCIKIALKKGRFALFEDCGLGKTFQQLEWAKQVNNKTNKPVLILAPLAVVAQTIKEGSKFGINIELLNTNIGNPIGSLTGIYISNYEQLKNIDSSVFSGVVLDESSILKGKDGKLSNLIISTFKKTEYKLACTATSSPNSHLELGMHVQFLGFDTYENMKSMFFVQDHQIAKGDKWRLRSHAKQSFWEYVCTWSISIDNPCTLGFNNEGYDLPEIEYVEHIIPVENTSNNLFGDVAVSATELHKDLKKSLDTRIAKTMELVNSNNEQWIVWTLKNDEAVELNKVLFDSVNVQGSDKPEPKAKNLNGFANKDFKTLITKTSIASFGMNYQNCSNMVFTSYDFKFEAFYQAVRRCYRFGQTKKVTVHLLVPESQLNVRSTIIEKERLHKEKQKEMAKYSSETKYEINKAKADSLFKEVKSDNYHLMNGDSFDLVKNISTESVDFSFFSPPFKDLYVYSDDPRDLSNVENEDQFYDQFQFLVPELYRVLKSGRLLSMHIMQGTTSIGKDGFLSIRDFRGDLIRLFQKNGFYFHSEKMIRKSPQLAAVRTKNIQLMHGQTKRDSSISRCGLADYIITFRKQGKNQIPIKNEIAFDDWCNMAEPHEYSSEVEIDVLQKINEPAWLDIIEGDVLKNYKQGRDSKDERHMTPTQLPAIRNSMLLYSNVGDTVLDPFGGAGSTGFQAIKMDRKSISIELKESYFNINLKNHKAIDLEKKSTLTLF